MRVALGLEYDGARFCGWQSQVGGCGVQDVLEQALAKIAGHPVSIVAAGRTDAGVHALMQVVHFDTDAVRPDQAWIRGVNAWLPPAVRVLWACNVKADFHARFAASGRHYEYLLLNQPTAPAVLAGKVGWFHRPLDVEAMRKAAAMLVGEHDFSAFRAAECQAKSPVKQLRYAEIYQHGGYLLFAFGAGAFLHRQVRNMVGALLYVGKGQYPPEWMRILLAARDRRMAPPTFAPDGLYLTGIDYPLEFNLPSCRRSLREWPWPMG